MRSIEILASAHATADAPVPEAKYPDPQLSEKQQHRYATICANNLF